MFLFVCTYIVYVVQIVAVWMSVIDYLIHNKINVYSPGLQYEDQKVETFL